MSTLACIYHWYTSAMFVVPVLAVGGWGWWSSKHMTSGDHDDDPPASTASLGDGPAY
ncbi:MAG: hypothetical protein ACRDK2_03440 [Solirubrobacteraceae bacterium]